MSLLVDGSAAAPSRIMQQLLTGVAQEITTSATNTLKMKVSFNYGGIYRGCVGYPGLFYIFDSLK